MAKQIKKEVEKTTKTVCSSCGRDITKNQLENEKFVICFNCNKFTASGSNNYKKEIEK